MEFVKCKKLANCCLNKRFRFIIDLFKGILVIFDKLAGFLCIQTTCALD